MFSVAVLALFGVSSTATGGRLQSCYSCSSQTAGSECHLQPVGKLEMTVRCAERTALCVTDRRQAEDGSFLSVQRRCSSREEAKNGQNRCEPTSSGLRCITLCYGNFCNFGTGQLFLEDRPWDYDDPQYSDYVYDPEEAVLTDRKRPVSGPLPVGTGEFPASGRVTLQEAVSGGVVREPPALLLMITLVMVVGVCYGE